MDSIDELRELANKLGVMAALPDRNSQKIYAIMKFLYKATERIDSLQGRIERIEKHLALSETE